MRGFQHNKTVEVTLRRGTESVTYRLEAPPPGWVSWLRSVWPVPTITRPGKSPEPDPAEQSAHADRFLLVLIGKCLGAETGVTIDGRSPGEWNAVADQLLAVFRTACLTDSDLQTLGHAVLEEFEKPQRGN